MNEIGSHLIKVVNQFLGKQYTQRDLLIFPIVLESSRTLKERRAAGSNLDFHLQNPPKKAVSSLVSSFMLSLIFIPQKIKDNTTNYDI